MSQKNLGHFPFNHVGFSPKFDLLGCRPASDIQRNLTSHAVYNNKWFCKPSWKIGCGSHSYISSKNKPGCFRKLAGKESPTKFITIGNPPQASFAWAYRAQMRSECVPRKVSIFWGQALVPTACPPAPSNTTTYLVQLVQLISGFWWLQSRIYQLKNYYWECQQDI